MIYTKDNRQLNQIELRPNLALMLHSSLRTYSRGKKLKHYQYNLMSHYVKRSILRDIHINFLLRVQLMLMDQEGKEGLPITEIRTIMSLTIELCSKCNKIVTTVKEKLVTKNQICISQVKVVAHFSMLLVKGLTKKTYQIKHFNKMKILPITLIVRFNRSLKGMGNQINNNNSNSCQGRQKSLYPR